MLSVKNIPFIMVIFSTFFAFYWEMQNVSKFNYIPDMLTVAIFVLLVATGKLSIPVRAVWPAMPVVLVIIVVISYNLFNARDLTGESSLIGLVVLVLIYLLFFFTDKSYWQAHSLWKQIYILYAIHVVYILFEMIVLISNDYIFMKSIFPTYRYLEGQPIYQLLGIKSFGGANGLMIGAQVASQMLALSIIWFAPIYRYKFVTNKHHLNNYIWVISIIFYPFCMTGTSLLLLFVLSLLALFFIPKKMLIRKIVYLRVFALALLIIGVLTGSLYDMLAYRLNAGALFDFYLLNFINPIIMFIDLPLENKLFGMQSDFSLLISADFGLGMILWMGGILLFSIIVLTFLLLLLRIFFVLRYQNFNESLSPWRTLAAAAAISSLGWFLSLIHYGVAAETGGKQFFAFVVAAAIISIIRLGSTRNSNNRTIPNNTVRSQTSI